MHSERCREASQRVSRIDGTTAIELDSDYLAESHARILTQLELCAPRRL